MTCRRCYGTPSSVVRCPTYGPGSVNAAFSYTTFAEAVTTWNERYNQRAWVRQLEGTIERHHEDRLMEIIARFDGRPFPTTPGLIRRWAKARLRRSSSLETIYCAELVATTYQHMGLLPSHRPANWYDPGRFWSGDHLELVPPFALADEIAVR